MIAVDVRYLAPIPVFVCAGGGLSLRGRNSREIELALN